MKAVIILGPDEEAKGQVMVKNLASGEQAAFMRDGLVELVRKLVG